MAGNIKGITIELNGDTTKLDKALRNVNKETKDVQKQLQEVERALMYLLRQDLMGRCDYWLEKDHMDTYTHLGLDDAQMELKRLQAQEQNLKDAEEERGKLLKFAQ